MAWLCNTKIWWRNKIVLYGYREFHCVHKKDYIHKDIAEDVETNFDTNYELDRPLSKGKNRKVIRLMKDELGAQSMIKFFWSRAKTYSYLRDEGSEDKKAKSTKKCVIKRNRRIENYKSCLEATQHENKIKYMQKNNINIHSLEKS